MSYKATYVRRIKKVFFVCEDCHHRKEHYTSQSAKKKKVCDDCYIIRRRLKNKKASELSKSQRHAKTVQAKPSRSAEKQKGLTQKQVEALCKKLGKIALRPRKGAYLIRKESPCITTPPSAPHYLFA